MNRKTKRYSKLGKQEYGQSGQNTTTNYENYQTVMARFDCTKLVHFQRNKKIKKLTFVKTLDVIFKAMRRGVDFGAKFTGVAFSFVYTCHVSLFQFLKTSIFLENDSSNLFFCFKFQKELWSSIQRSDLGYLQPYSRKRRRIHYNYHYKIVQKYYDTIFLHYLGVIIERSAFCVHFPRIWLKIA